MHRRLFLLAAAAAFPLISASPALALNAAGAESLVDKVVADINKVINSGKSETAMYKDFERIFDNYADVPIIARTTLGPPARTATAAQMKAYTAAFRTYISRKYGRRFREFIGGGVEVRSSRAINDNFEVLTMATLAGQPPFEVSFRVSDKSGRDLFYDMLIEGISLLKSEKSEVGALLDRNRGDLDAMIADLAKAG